MLKSPPCVLKSVATLLICLVATTATAADLDTSGRDFLKRKGAPIRDEHRTAPCMTQFSPHVGRTLLLVTATPAKGKFEHLCALNVTPEALKFKPLTSIPLLREIETFSRGKTSLPALDPVRSKIQRISVIAYSGDLVIAKNLQQVIAAKRSFVEADSKGETESRRIESGEELHRMIRLEASFVEADKGQQSELIFQIPLRIPPLGWDHFGIRATELIAGPDGL